MNQLRPDGQVPAACTLPYSEVARAQLFAAVSCPLSHGAIQVFFAQPQIRLSRLKGGLVITYIAHGVAPAFYTTFCRSSKLEHMISVT